MSQSDPEMLTRFEKSLTRCTSDSSFMSRFYARFLLASDEIAELFEGVDMSRQAGILRASLYHMLRAANGLEDGRAHLHDIARSHSKKGYDIRPAHYEHWLESLIAAAEEVDPEFDADTRAAWEGSLRPSIEVMTAQWADG